MYTEIPSDHLAGICHKHLVRDDDGQVWLVKFANDREINSEVFAYITSMYFDVDVPEVREWQGPGLCSQCYHTGGSMMRWVDGTQTWRDARQEIEERGARNMPKEYMRNLLIDALKMSVFDRYIGNLDRNTGNWLVRSDGHVYAIDHGFTAAIVKSIVLDDIGYDYPYAMAVECLTPDDIDALSSQYMSMIDDAADFVQDALRQIPSTLKRAFTRSIVSRISREWVEGHGLGAWQEATGWKVVGMP